MKAICTCSTPPGDWDAGHTIHCALMMDPEYRAWFLREYEKNFHAVDPKPETFK